MEDMIRKLVYYKKSKEKYKTHQKQILLLIPENFTREEK